MTKDACLDQRTRAEDIILGALGYGEGAKIISIKKVENGKGFCGTGCWVDGEQFEFQSEDELSVLEVWALGVLSGGAV